MIVEQGRVLEREGDRAKVLCAASSGCPRCAEGKGCGAGLWSGLSAVTAIELSARVQAPDVRRGDDVMLGVEETALLRAAFYLYGVPLVSMLSAALAAHLAWGGESWTVVSALAGLGCGFVLARILSSRAESDGSYRPLIIGRAVPAPVPTSRWR